MVLVVWYMVYGYVGYMGYTGYMNTIFHHGTRSRLIEMRSGA